MKEAAVLEFYGVCWVMAVGGARPKFFDSEDDALRAYACSLLVVQLVGAGGLRARTPPTGSKAGFPHDDDPPCPA